MYTYKFSILHLNRPLYLTIIANSLQLGEEKARALLKEAWASDNMPEKELKGIRLVLTHIEQNFQ